MKQQSTLATLLVLSLSAVALQHAHAQTATPAGASAAKTRSSDPSASGSSATFTATTSESDTEVSSVPAPRNETQYLSRIASRYDNLAGSRSNLKNLVRGLRTGSEVELTGAAGTKPVTFTPVTPPMGYASVTRALNLAGKQLAAAGIKKPTPHELQAALNGGIVKTAQGSRLFQGVLKLRSAGMGWGQIARMVGVQPGTGKTADQENGTRGSSAAAAAAGANTLNPAGGSAGVATASANGRANVNGRGGKN
jgi:opacity protein-like surface antigen